MLKIAVLISGAGSNLKALLAASAQQDSKIEIVCVASDNSAQGLAHAAQAGVPYRIFPPLNYPDRAAWGEALATYLREHEVALVVAAGLMRILPPNFVAAFSPNLINTHPALLPLFPGAHAVRDALAAGATSTGVTVHIIDEGVDTGPVLRQSELPIHPGESADELHERIKRLERPLLVSVVTAIANGEIDLAAASARQQ